MNKAFVREPDSTADYCPYCGSKGQPVGGATLETHLSEEQRRGLSDPAAFCPSPKCRVAYFDAFERVVLAADLQRPVYPKDPDAPLCACLGFTRADIEADVQEGVVTRTRKALAHAKSPAARCCVLAANGQSCEAYVQKCYLQCRGGKQ